MQALEARYRLTTSVPDPNSPLGENAPQALVLDPAYLELSLDLDTEDEEQEQKSKRPTENNFSQQRLAAINPVFSARTVIHMLIALGIIFIPLGVGMWFTSNKVEDMMIEYTQCELQANSDYWKPIPKKYVTFNLKTDKEIPSPMWRLNKNLSIPYLDEQNVCEIHFTLPEDLEGPLRFFYRLKNFHQNHRRYGQSFSNDQLLGQPIDKNLLMNAVGINCEPLIADPNGKIYYPCGLVSNSYFNDTFSHTFAGVNGTTKDYVLTNKNITWPSNYRRFRPTRYNYTQIAPPPNWIKMFPDGYNETNVPDILKWEELQAWMHTSAFADFRKLSLKGVDRDLPAGTYQINIGLHFPVIPYRGHKYIFLSLSTVLGGKNFFFGYLWMAFGGVCILLGLFVLFLKLARPRKSGDVNKLSWNELSYHDNEKEEEEKENENTEEKAESAS